MEFIDEFIKSFNKLKGELNSNANSRYLSREYCYGKFHEAFDNLNKLNDDDYLNLSLHLSFYLASWGMYRGSSFLLQFDYKIHLQTVKLILKDKYKPLIGYNWDKDDKNYSSNLNLLFGSEGLINLIKEKYEPFRKEVENEDEPTKQAISDILVTKILLGTLGCVPAYDEMLKRALKFGKDVYGENKENIENKFIQKFGKKSFEVLVDFYSINKDILEKEIGTLTLKDLPSIEYPQMKLLDMGLWKLGLEKLKENGKIEKDKLKSQAK